MKDAEEWCLLGCYAVTSQNAPFFIVIAVETSNLTYDKCCLLEPSSYLTGDTVHLRYRASRLIICNVRGFHSGDYD
jgi:hypothetical protein